MGNFKLIWYLLQTYLSSTHLCSPPMWEKNLYYRLKMMFSTQKLRLTRKYLTVLVSFLIKKKDSWLKESLLGFHIHYFSDMMNKMAWEFWKVKSTHLKVVVEHWANILHILLIDGPNCIQFTDFFSHFGTQRQSITFNPPSINLFYLKEAQFK